MENKNGEKHSPCLTSRWHSNSELNSLQYYIWAHHYSYIWLFQVNKKHDNAVVELRCCFSRTTQFTTHILCISYWVCSRRNKI